MRLTSDEYLNVMALVVNKVVLEPVNVFINNVGEVISDIPTKHFMKTKGDKVNEIWDSATLNHKKYVFIKELERLNGINPTSSNIKITGQI